MASQIKIQSFNQFLGAMIRTIIANTPLNDVNPGSVLLTILEAAAANDFENSAAILSLLNILNLDTVSDSDLDNRAADFGLTRNAATKSSGNITIFNTNITKQSTSLYVIKPAPIQGQTTLFVNNTTGWANSGTLYIGRGTTSFEGPIAYTSITIFPTYSQINLASALQSNHLISDTVVNAQGQPDRIIASGTVVKLPANNQNPEVSYVTLRDAVLLAGETEVTGVASIALVTGSIGNAPINTITQFDAIPFAGATVSNESAFTGGFDAETDQDLRNRIKAYPNTLARGTAASILAAVEGVSDADENKQVASAVIEEPPSIGDPAILYIDDGKGFQPSYSGQSVDTLLTNASGNEQFLQLANFPVTRPQVINTGIGPYTLKDGSYMKVAVDGVQETIFFNVADFINISAAQIAEVIIVINNQAQNFSARLTNNSNSILIYPKAFNSEILQVIPLQSIDDPTLYANSVFQFPTSEFSFISLFQNNTRLREKTVPARLETAGFASWNITSAGNLSISVDGTPEQDRSFSLSNFPGAPSFATLTLQDWVDAFNEQFAGITAIATANQTMQLTSNQGGDNSALDIVSGTLRPQLFPTQATSAIGQVGQFILNRQTGNLEILTDINAGDNITAGIEDAKGFVNSAPTISGNYDLSNDGFGRPSEVIIVADSTYCDKRTIALALGSTLAVTNPSTNVMRIMSDSVSAFPLLLPGDFIFFVQRTTAWLSAGNLGLYKIVSKGSHTTAGVDSYVDVLNPGVVVESVSVADTEDVQAFATDGYPQRWLGSFTPTPAVATLTDIVDSMNESLINVLASVYQSNAIKVTSTTERNGSIAMPVVVGKATTLFEASDEVQEGNPPLVANIVSSKSLLSHFKIAQPTNANTFLSRQVFRDSKGALTANAIPDSPPYSGTYSETIESTGALNTTYFDYNSIVNFTRGNNRGQLRSIAAFIATDKAGTQQALARTNLKHTTGDEIEALKPLQLSASDSVVVVMDNDPQNNTININMARTGQVNSGSNMLSFSPTTTEFSANDYDNEPGIDFSDPTVWSTSLNNTNFADYAAWFRARNWYSSGGVGAGLGVMILRAAEYGPNGNFLRYNMQYPTIPNQDALTSFINTPSFSTFSYYFGSGPARATALTNGDTISVKGPYPNSTTNFPNGVVSSGNYFDYTFSAGSFGTVVTGDVLSITPSSGVSLPNQGQFGIKNLSGNTVRVFNPNASVTTPGTPEVDTITTIADVLGTPTVYTIYTVADVAGSINGEYFTIYDTAGSVAVWFNESGTAAQPSAGTNRYIMVGTILANDNAATVATKITNALNQDAAFTAGVSGNQITITNVQNGALAAAFSDPYNPGFGYSTVTGTNNASLTGKYFTVYDDVGSVAVWFDVGDQGTLEPFHGADRSIRVSTFSPGASSSTVASAIATAVNLDIKFTASSLSNVVTITNVANGNVPNPAAGTSGFSVSSVNGTNTTAESITNIVSVNIFPLTGTTTLDISGTINDSDLMTATPVGLSSLTITVSTREEDYTYVSNATALSYGHNPTSSTLREYVGLYDGANWVKLFQNANPNFTFKTTFTLNGVAPSVYQMNTAPNFETGVGAGELFKLIPTTVQNLYHHFTQKALSQLPIVATINISNDRKNLQIRSNKLGSLGAVEFIGGTGNQAKMYIEAESEIETDSSGSFLVLKTSAFPDTFSVGDSVLLENDAGVNRLSRLRTSDTLDVTNPSAGVIEYVYNNKSTGITSGTTFTIADVSASYSLPAGYVWRWTAGGGGVSFSNVVPGDLLYAFGTLVSAWDQNNRAKPSGDGEVSGLPIVAVNVGSNYVDVSNPHGKVMSSTSVGTGTVQICPSPIVKWSLRHAAYIALASISRTSNVVTVTSLTPHFLSSGDSFSLRDSTNLADGVYTSITTTGAKTFTFASVGANFSETVTHASILKSTLTQTRYRLQALGFNDLVRLNRQDGESPGFVSSGVAVDDYLVLSGSTFNSTFSSNNNGRFRVLAVDNDSIIFKNLDSTDQLNTVRAINNMGIDVTFTANTNTITGIAGAFKYLSVGDWIKKQSDPDTYFVQVLSLNNTPALATSITLGNNYPGTSNTTSAIFYKELTDYDKGVHLQSPDDIAIYEGDSVIEGDTLFVQNIVNPSWFNINNTGSFPVVEHGTTAGFEPFIRISNTTGVAQAGVAMSVNTGGFYIIESLTNKFYTIREVVRTVIDDADSDLRKLYITPFSRSYKFSVANNSSVNHLGKLGYSNTIVVGIDGYTYYTGLLRRVQRIVDGYEPDATNFPGRRAVGSAIETLPPLPFQVNLELNITTNEGVNLGDVTNNVKTTIIKYIEGLAVGAPIILSQIIANVMQIKGIASVTFTNPVPSTQSISLNSNEKAIISASNISVA